MTDPRIIANLDQEEQALIVFAGMLGNYYKALLESGIPEDAAKNLVADYHALVLSQKYYEPE